MIFFVQACGSVLVPKISWGESDLCNQSKWRVLVEDIECAGGKCFMFGADLGYFKKQKYATIIFFQKVLWEDNSCEENLCQTKLPKKKMKNSDLLKKNNDLRWAIRFFFTKPIIHSSSAKYNAYFLCVLPQAWKQIFENCLFYVLLKSLTIWNSVIFRWWKPRSNRGITSHEIPMNSAFLWFSYVCVPHEGKARIS